MNQDLKRKLLIVLTVLIVMTISFAGWWIDHRDSRRSPWKAATVTYDSKCEGECLNRLQTVAVLNTPHLKGVKILWRPDIDDAIAQVGDCLDSIMACMDEVGGDPSHTAECVTKAKKCPEQCKKAYADQFNASMTAERQMEGVEAIFLADDGVCAPREHTQ